MKSDHSSETPFSNLTEAEISGFKSKYDLANGHAYHDLHAGLRSVIDELPTIWKASAQKTIPEIEEEFKNASASIFGSQALAKHKHYSVAPTASNSIDIVGAWLGEHGHNVGLLEPAFDNLYLLLKRRGVKTTSFQENDLLDMKKLEEKIDTNNLKSLFIVTPNNPTGFQLDAAEFKDICDLCARKDVSLIVDKTFRLYSKNDFDDYKVLKDSGVNYVVIEDTGKTWPTLDMKASLLAYSALLANGIRQIYEEIYLGASIPALAILTKMLQKTEEVGLDKVVRQEVTKRMKYVEDALASTPLKLIKDEKACAMPLAWIDCSATGNTDLELVQRLKAHEVALLPGRFFYWDSQDKHTGNVRLSLMKPDNIFYKGVDVLKAALSQPNIAQAAPARDRGQDHGHERPSASEYGSWYRERGAPPTCG